MIRCVEHPSDKRKRQARELPVPQRLLLWVIVMSLLAAALAVGLSILFYYLLLRPSGPIVPGNITQLTDIGKVSLAVVAGVGGVVALVVSFKKQRLSELSHEIAVSSLERDRERILNERFASAVAQLGDSSSASVRIGGVYSLAKLADDWPTDRQRCIDVLCAYLRFPGGGSDDKTNEAEVRRTLSSVIQEHLKRNAPTSWDGNIFNLRGASLDGLSLADIWLTRGSILILADCKVTTGTFDLSGIWLESGTIDASELTMTGGKIDLGKTTIRGGQILFKRARFDGGKLSLAGARAHHGMLCFDGSKIDGGELDLSGMEIWCTDERFAYDVRLSLNQLVIADGLLNLQYSRLVVADTEKWRPDENDINHYIVLTMESVTMTGGGISLHDTELPFGGLAFRNLTISGGVLDFSGTKIHERARIELRGSNIRGGVIDFSNAWFGSTLDQKTPNVGHSWVRGLKEEKTVESRRFWKYGHPPGHIDLSNSTMEAGLIKFERSELKGAVVLLYGLEMSGGRIGFDFCVYTKAVVSLWNVRLEADAIIDFTQNYMESMEPPVIIYSQYYNGLGEHVRLHNRSCLLEISSAD
jgi:hypothetical protein